MTDNILLHDVSPTGVATVTLNRPDVHNAFNEQLIAALRETFASLGSDPAVRAIVLSGNGKSFSAGADLDWMKRAAGFDAAQNEEDARALSDMLATINDCPKPVIARVHGAAMGGGVGLVACADIAIAVRDARFALSEVRLGLTPATISPYVIAKIGASQARRLFLTAERFEAKLARKIGLVHVTVGSPEDLDTALEKVVRDILAGAPGAQADCKALVRTVAGAPITPELRQETARHIAARRTSDEGREGIAAFLEKRAPGWSQTS